LTLSQKQSTQADWSQDENLHVNKALLTCNTADLLSGDMWYPMSNYQYNLLEMFGRGQIFTELRTGTKDNNIL